MIITITTRPETGSRERVCHICSEHYVGWNFVCCPTCEREVRHTVTVVEAWRV